MAKGGPEKKQATSNLTAGGFGPKDSQFTTKEAGSIGAELSRKLAWAVGTTYQDQIGENMPADLKNILIHVLVRECVTSMEFAADMQAKRHLTKSE